jgi:four helix bundle suffix protein
MRERLKHDVYPNLPAAPKNKIVLTGLAGLADFVAKTTPELAANAMLCAVNQAAYLLKRQIESQARDFKEHGGFTERLHATRVQSRAKQEGNPPCPVCGKPMRRRTAGKTSSQFWGCTTYPNCKGTRPIEP